MKLESLRARHLPNQTTVLQDIKGFQGTNRIISKLLAGLENEITLASHVSKFSHLDLKAIFQDVATNIIQPQDDNLKLYHKLRNLSDIQQLNHVHFTNFKQIFYRILVECEIKQRTLKKLMKAIDYFKSAIMRVPRIKDLLDANYQFHIYQMVPDKRNLDLQKRQIELLLQYILNNHQRLLKKEDVALLNIREVCS